MNRLTRTVCVVVVGALASLLVVLPALAGPQPIVTGLSTQHGAYWGGQPVTVYGRNFADVREVRFGSKDARAVHVVSPTEITVRAPYHSYDTVYVRVVTSTGTSAKVASSSFRFTRPSMNDPIQGGLTGRQEQDLSDQVRARHHGVQLAGRSRAWTPAMGRTAAARAQSWLGMPYSWAGGNGSGPTRGVCAHNGGDLDCRIVGFDCSGLTLYSWWPYKHLVHYAATQYRQAGRFHPAIGQLVPGDLVFFAGYVPGGIGHTAVYAGNGMIIQAPQSGSQVVRSRLTDVIAGDGPYRGAARPLSTGRQAAGPVVTSMTETMSTKGGTLTVVGRGLADATSVIVGHTAVYRFATRTAGKLVVALPAHSAGRATVAVSNPWGTARRALTYVGAPQVSALSPASGPVTGGNRVTLTGKNLSLVTKVVLGTTPVPFTRLGTGQLVVVMPAYSAGPVALTAISPYGRSAARTYTYTTPPPTPSPSQSPPTSSSAPADTSQAPSPTASAPGSSTSAPGSSTSSPPPTSGAPESTGTSPSTSSSTVPTTASGTPTDPLSSAAG